MKIVSILLTVTLAATAGFASQAEQKLVPNNPNAARNAQKRGVGVQPPGLEVIQGFYLSRLKQQTEISDELYARLRPLLMGYLRERAEIGGPRRMRAQRQLFQAVNRGATDDELIAAMKEFDRIDGDVVGSKEKFFSSADPLLTVRQRAKLRVFMVNMENQVNQMIRLSQAPPPPRRN